MLGCRPSRSRLSPTSRGTRLSIDISASASSARMNSDLSRGMEGARPVELGAPVTDGGQLHRRQVAGHGERSADDRVGQALGVVVPFLEALDGWLRAHQDLPGLADALACELDAVGGDA